MGGLPGSAIAVSKAACVTTGNNLVLDNSPDLVSVVVLVAIPNLTPDRSAFSIRASLRFTAPKTDWDKLDPSRWTSIKRLGSRVCMKLEFCNTLPDQSPPSISAESKLAVINVALCAIAPTNDASENIAPFPDAYDKLAPSRIAFLSSALNSFSPPQITATQIDYWRS